LINADLRFFVSCRAEPGKQKKTSFYQQAALQLLLRIQLKKQIQKPGQHKVNS
jgi:hypothetical protein